MNEKPDYLFLHEYMEKEIHRLGKVVERARESAQKRAVLLLNIEKSEHPEVLALERKHMVSALLHAEGVVASVQPTIEKLKEQCGIFAEIIKIK